MEIKGKIVHILEAEKGTSQKGEWKKQSYVIETFGEYPKNVCIQVWNDKINLDNYKVGNVLNSHINVESREWKEKWFTDIRVWKVDSEAQDMPTEQENNDQQNTLTPDNDLPF